MASQRSRYSSGDQKEVDRIKKCKDHYEILGVSKTATTSQIKNAYKELARNIHPDKNKCPGATEAFQKLAKAKDTLSDQGKRYDYNLSRTNVSNPPRASTSNSTSNRSFNSRTSNRTSSSTSNTDSDTDFEQREWQKPQTQNANNNHYYLYLLGIAVVVLFTALILVPSNTKKSSKGSDPLYSLKSNPKFFVVRRTLDLKIRYYVEGNFVRRFRGSSLDKLEKAVEKEYFEDLERTCSEQKSYLFLRQVYMKFKSWIMFEEVEEIRMPACNKLENFGTRIFRTSFRDS